MMGNFYDKEEFLTLDQKIDRLDEVIGGLCERFDKFEMKLSQMNSDYMNQIVQIIEEMKNFMNSEHNSKGNGCCEKTIENKIIQTEHVESVKIVYSDIPYGNVFEVINITDSKTSRSLYQIEIISPTMAKFFPLVEKMGRLKLNMDSAFTPLCESDCSLMDAESFVVDSDDYGILELVENSYWEVKKKCFIKCK